MENEIQLSHVFIRFLNADTRCSYFQLLASKDEQKWDTLISKGGSCGFVDDYQLFKIPTEYTSETYKYVKYVGMMNSENYWNSVNEILFYGDLGELGNVTSIEPGKGLNLVLYPNPVRTDLNIKLDNVTFADNGGCTITILNYVGQTIHSKNISSIMEFPVTIPVGDLQRGVYILRLEIENKQDIITRKFLVE
jgi:hypothetical protein